MRSILDWPLLRELRSRRLLFPLALLAAVAVVLLQGILSRVPPAPLQASPSSPPVSLPALRPDLEKTPLSYFSDYWLQLGDRVRGRLALVGNPETPAISIAPGLLLTSIRASQETSPGERGAVAGEARLVAADDALEVALFELDGASAPPPFERADPAGLGPGSLVAAVTLAPDRRLQVAPGHLIAGPVDGGPGSPEDNLDVSIVLPGRTRVAAIVDLDGRLVGAALEARSGTRFLSAPALLRIAERLRASPVCHSIEVAEPSGAVRQLLAVDGGVVVERVRPGSFVPGPSIRAGDVLLEWSGQKVSRPEEFRRQYDAQPPGSLVPFLVLRGGRRVAGRTVMPGRDCRPVGDPPLALEKAGLRLRWVSGGDGAGPAGWRVLGVAPGGAAAASGLAAGDRIVAIDGRDLDERASRRALEGFAARPRPLLLTVRRGDRVKLLALSPGPDPS